MTSPLVITQLDALESQATQHLEEWRKSCWEFTETILTIKSTGVWQEVEGIGTFEQYLEQRWIPLLPFGVARIRQFEAAYPVMEYVKELTGIVLNENQIRTLKAIVPDEYRYLLPEIVSRTHAYTSSPAKRHYAATYNVLLERERLASVTIDGQSHSVDITQSAVLEAVLESDMRRNDHITSNGKWDVVNRYEFKSALDARQAFQELSELQVIDTDMAIMVIVKRLKSVTPVTDVDVNEVEKVKNKLRWSDVLEPKSEG